MTYLLEHIIMTGHLNTKDTGHMDNERSGSASVSRIAHRGNTEGRKPEFENAPWYLWCAFNRGFHAEADFWYKDGQFWLGHDEPQYKCVDDDLLEHPRLWAHAKNFATLRALLARRVHCFMNDTDPVCFTSHTFIWAFPWVYNRNMDLVGECRDSFPL